MPKVYQETKDATLPWAEPGPSEMLQAIRANETKLVGVFASSSVLMGVSVSFAIGADIGLLEGLPLIFLAVATLVYLAIVVITLWQIYPTPQMTSHDPTTMWRYWQFPCEQAVEERWRVLCQVFKHNYKVTMRKAKFLSVTSVLLGVELILLGAWIVSSSLLPSSC